MYVSILNYRTGEVIIHSYSEDFDEDMEEFIADKLEHNDFHRFYFIQGVQSFAVKLFDRHWPHLKLEPT